MSLTKTFVRGVFWEGIKKYSRYLVSLLVTAVLARILSADDFGLIATVLVFSGFVQIFTESGINSAVVQKKYLKRNDLSTVFWFSFFFGATLALLNTWLAPYVEEFFQIDDLATVFKVMSANLFIVSVKAVPLGLLRRELRFNILAIIEISALVVSGGVAIVAALKGFGYWALVFQILLSHGLTLVPLFYFSKFRPKIQFETKILIEVLSFSLYITAFRAVNYWSRNADNLLIGKYLGPDSLGLYSQAYKLLMLPVGLLTGILNPVMHPIFSGIKEDKKRFSVNYLKVVKVIAILSFPMSLFFFYSANEIISILWGERWIEAAGILKILALLTLFQPIISTTGGVLMSLDSQNLLFKLGVFNSIIMIGGMVAGLTYGAKGVATGYAISYMFLVVPITLFFVLKKLKISFGAFGKSLLEPFVIFLTLLIVYAFCTPYLAEMRSFLSISLKILIFITVVGFFVLKNHRQNLRKFLVKR